MGSIIFPPQSLADNLSEVVGCKSGLTLSIEGLCDHLSGTGYPDTIRQSEQNIIRIRAEDYETLYYKLLYRIGCMNEECTGIPQVDFYNFCHGNGLLSEYWVIMKAYGESVEEMIKQAESNNSKSLDPTKFFVKVYGELGELGLDIAQRFLVLLNQAIDLNPHSANRYTQWSTRLSLEKLFSGTHDKPEGGRFIDQRYINYLCNNPEKLPVIHWRKFEELTAEFFYREGYRVELGPGSNDDGVDVRVWRASDSPSDNPLCLIQCKRQKSKIEKVVVKGLYADVTFEGAAYGVIVTTSELSPGARGTISARGYPVREVNHKGLSDWLLKLRRPGTGIVRV